MKEYVLITGGAGFIGSHIIDELVNNNYNVISIDINNDKAKDYLNPQCIYIEENILSDKVEDVFYKYNVKYVIHMAAQTSVSYSFKNPLYDAENNILGTINLLNLSKKYNVEKFIAASSAAVYGNINNLPIHEEQETNPISFYGLSKLTMENYIKLYEINYIIYRFSNVYGERQTTDGEAGVISIFNNLISQNKDIIIDGDGEQTRDFVYVKDVAKIIVSSLESNINKETVHLSLEQSYSINTLVKYFLEYYKNYTGKIVYCKPRIGDIKHSLLSNNKIWKLLKSKPTTKLDIGLKNILKI